MITLGLCSVHLSTIYLNIFSTLQYSSLCYLFFFMKCFEIENIKTVPLPYNITLLAIMPCTHHLFTISSNAHKCQIKCSHIFHSENVDMLSV